MRSGLKWLLFVFGSATISPAVAEDAPAKWATVKGRVVFAKGAEVPVMADVKVGGNQDCLAKGNFKDETFVIDPKTRAMSNVFVWIEPADSKRGEAFPKDLIHPKLAKAAGKKLVIDQPCCMFEPRAQAAREGDTLTIKNSAPIAHNAKYDTASNGETNALIPSGGKYDLPKPLVAEKTPLKFVCNIHGWMQANVAVFDRPYFATTGKDGTFELKMAPAGNFKLYLRHESGFSGGIKGATKPQVIEIKPGQDLDLGDIDFVPN